MVIGYSLDGPGLCVQDSEGFVFGDGQERRTRLIKLEASECFLGQFELLLKSILLV